MRASPCCFVLRCGRLLSRPVLPSIRAPPSSHFFASCPSCRFFAANVQNIPVRGICMSGIIAVSFVLLGYAAFCIAFPQVTGSNAGWLSWCWFAYLPRTGIICALAPIFRQLESRKKIYLAKRTLIPRNEHLTPSLIPYSRSIAVTDFSVSADYRVTMPERARANSRSKGSTLTPEKWDICPIFAASVN